jgi:hypothetical protein
MGMDTTVSSTATSDTSPQRGSFGEWLHYIGIDCTGKSKAPYWPPDVFAVTAAFLRRTGAYVEFIDAAADLCRAGECDEASDPAKVGKVWEAALSRDAEKPEAEFNPVPEQIAAWWSTFAQPALSLEDAGKNADVKLAAWRLCIACDEACQGIGIKPGSNKFLALAHQTLVAQNKGLSFCRTIRADKLAVLGKQHTPQRGCTVRSLTHHLSLHEASEIEAKWAGPYQPDVGSLDVLNLLLLPWPTDVSASDFRMSAGSGSNAAHRYFEYEPSDAITPHELASRVERALEQAQTHAERIDGIIFPEVSLSLPQFYAVEEVAAKRGAMVVAGVRESAREAGTRKPVNTATIQPVGRTLVEGVPSPEVLRHTRWTQSKHHRWCLERNQILQYELGGRLPASHECWEDIALGKRRINFVTLGSWLTVCVLICEDLARQDPIADVIRAVGPNIVFALLMDGPQLRSRWPSRHATVLAEDPGSSVLTLTSLGMAKRSKPGDDVDRQLYAGKPPVIALWRDIDGTREIALPEGHDACVLSLVCRSKREYTLDGRSDDQSHFPVYAGTYTFNSAGKAGGKVQ